MWARTVIRVHASSLHSWLKEDKQQKRVPLETGQSIGLPMATPIVPEEDIVNPESATELLQCAICLGILVEPVRTPCSHWFCRECIEDVLPVHKSQGLRRCDSCVCVCASPSIAVFLSSRMHVKHSSGQIGGNKRESQISILRLA